MINDMVTLLPLYYVTRIGPDGEVWARPEGARWWHRAIRLNDRGASFVDIEDDTLRMTTVVYYDIPVGAHYLRDPEVGDRVRVDLETKQWCFENTHLEVLEWRVNRIRVLDNGRILYEGTNRVEACFAARNLPDATWKEKGGWLLGQWVDTPPTRLCDVTPATWRHRRGDEPQPAHLEAGGCYVATLEEGAWESRRLYRSPV